MPKSKVCVVGGGAWGANHIKTLDKLGALGAIVEKNESLLRNLKKQYSYIDSLLLEIIFGQVISQNCKFN